MDTQEDFFDKLSGRLLESDADKIDFSTIEIEDVDNRDYPDFCDAYCSSVRWKNGAELNEEELEDFNELFYSTINEAIHENQLYM